MDGAQAGIVPIQPLLGAISGLRLLCFGDVMLDRFVHGRVERISPEAPVPVLAVEGEIELPGGAANVARNAVALGAAVELIGLVGEDEAGARLAELARSAGLAAGLLAEPGRPTTVKTRYLSGGHQLLRADLERAAAPRAAAAGRLHSALEAALARVDAVALSDYGKGTLLGDLAGAAIARTRASGRFVAVDPRGPDWSRYRGADLLTPNRRELAEAAGRALRGLEDYEAAARTLMRMQGLGAVLVTLSEQGVLLVEAGQAHHLPATAREVADVTGAGDTVLAVITAAAAAGADLKHAAALANLAAGIVVGKLGTAVAAPRELLAALRPQGGGDRLVPLPEALEQVRRWRLTGQRIGLTNGCFDLLHAGHAGLIAFARAGCDRLLIALNDDASVRRLKGPERPVQPLAGRAAVLSALAAVDLVVPFSEDTPLALIEAIRPDLLVKGADYREEDVVGAALVRSYGGEVRLAPLAPGHSTTATLARLRAAADAGTG